VRGLAKSPTADCKSLGLKILPLSDYRPRITFQFPAKFMISIDPGGEGGHQKVN
jgi:hypothetical protein